MKKLITLLASALLLFGCYTGVPPVNEWGTVTIETGKVLVDKQEAYLQ